ncbi:T9SS type A sorting domain-containing protein [Tenacibaculum maritimum]|uniref:T9SS type A sorting domain-containing protein n=1 Tax=Tenacibaculum maritimum TaxID=107401 RepID=UPI0038775A0F
MKTKFTIVLGALLFSSFLIQAQDHDWRNAIFQKNSNYHDIARANRKSLKRLKKNTDRKSKKQLKQFERWAYFWKDRILPDGSFPAPSLNYNAWLQENKRHSSVNNNIPNWSFIGPLLPPTPSTPIYAGTGIGRLNTLVFHPNDDNIMYVGSPAGGVWKTTDGGNTWEPKGDGFPNMGVSHIAINPVNPNILYVATGDFDGRDNRSIGVLKSIDGGDTWNLTGLNFLLTENNTISKLLIDPRNPDTILATTKNSIKKSTDGGDTWRNVLNLGVNENYFNDIQYKYGSETTIYASSDGALYLSYDNGDNWDLFKNGHGIRIEFALTPANPNLILVLDEDGYVDSTTDEGISWQQKSRVNRNFNAQRGYNMAIAISPVDENLVLIGGVEGWRSKRGGLNWEKYLDGYWRAGRPYFYVHSDHHEMVFKPGTNIAYSLNDGGIYKGNASLDRPWEDISSGLGITQYYTISGTPRDPNLLIMGAQDNDISIYQGNPQFKGENTESDGVEGIWDYSNSNIAWTCSQSGHLRRTLDGFATPAQVVNTPGGAPFVWQLEIHPTTPSTIFGGFGDIYKSTNRGDDWINLNSGINGDISAIEISPSNPDIIYVTSDSDSEVKKTIDGGATWSSVNLPQVGSVKSVAIHPTKPNEIYITYSKYTPSKVFKSVDGGINWINITGALPNIPCHKIIYRTGSSDDELFLATDLGVYYRTNTSGDWTRLGQGLPNVIVNDIEIHYPSNKLRAATYGRGAWEVSIESLTLDVKDHKLPENSFTLYPNPANNKTFSINLYHLDDRSTILIYNSIGAIVKNIITNKLQETVNLSEFSDGIYFVKVTNGSKSATKKIMIN